MAGQCLLAGVRKELVYLPDRDRIIEKPHDDGYESTWEILVNTRQKLSNLS